MAGELLTSALRHIWATLTALKIDLALMGGIAVAAWQHIRNTRDVDLLISVHPSAEQALLQRLASLTLTVVQSGIARPRHCA